MRKRVLWVDDEIEFLRSHIMFLETRGYSVFPVFSGDDAVQLIQENPSAYDIVLLDEQMPGKDGLTTLGEIKEMQPDLPVVMVTKSEEERVMEIALGKKIDGYLTKPVNPSQILLVCKNILDSKQIISHQLSEKYLRNYTENRMRLSRQMSIPEWMRHYECLVNWDLELERTDNEGLRQMQAGQKSDSNALFCNLVAENYAKWVRNKDRPPLMSVDILSRVVAPEINQGRKVYLFVFSGMKYDQFITIEPDLKEMFSVTRSRFISSLPTMSEYSRPTLLCGQFPEAFKQDFPDLFSGKGLHEDETEMKKLVAFALKKLGVSAEVLYHNYKGTSDLLENNDSLLSGAQLAIVVVDIDKQFIQSRSSDSLLKEMASDEVAFRKLIKSWFQHSSLLQFMKELSHQDCTVILTSDHGHILCSRGTEIYGTREIDDNVRCLFGENLSADERNVVFLQEPGHFGIPVSGTEKCVIARESFRFIFPEKFEHYRSQYQNSFQFGGISLEEMIMPIYVCKPQGNR